MTATDSSFGSTLSLRAMVLLSVTAGVAVLFFLLGNVSALVMALFTFITDGGLAVVVFISAGGYGNVICGRLWDEDLPVGLRAATACGIGLIGFATLILAVGSFTHGLLTGWIWWPVIAGGLLLAAWRGREFLEEQQLPSRVHGLSLIWVLIVVAVAVWLAGATRPPLLVGTMSGDEYDVVEYHLQLPREYYENGHISLLRHNIYSFFPMGVEMLYLLGMCLRWGAYEGVYSAKLTGGLFTALAVMAVMSSFGRDKIRGWAAGTLLATTPFVLYLSWLAMVELGEVFYLALALLWLRRWTQKRSVREALCVGLAVGGACTVKYLSVGFVVLPILVMMVLLSLLKMPTMWHVVVVAAVTGVLFSPWLIRNAAATGNPVFPLATGLFGSGDHWSAAGPADRSWELQARWVDGHGPDKRPPVPVPTGWEMPPQPFRLKRFYQNFLTYDFFGPVTLVLAGVGLCVLVAVKGRTDPWEWSLVGTAGVQLAVWVWGTHEMPPRFIIPVIVPIILLVGGMLEKIHRLRGGPLTRMTDASGRPWGVVTASVLFFVAVGVNTLVSVRAGLVTRDSLARMSVPMPNGTPPGRIAEEWRLGHAMSADDKPMLVGEAKAFYFPSGVVYATAFDSHPLAEMIDSGMSARQILAALQQSGITHLYVNWREIVRLATTYGYPASLSAEPLSVLPEGQPRLTILEKMKSLGLEELPLPMSSEQVDGPEGAPAGQRIQWQSLYAVPAAGAADSPQAGAMKGHETNEESP